MHRTCLTGVPPRACYPQTCQQHYHLRIHCTHRAYKLSLSLRAPRGCHASLGLTNKGPVRSVTQTQRGRLDGRRGEPDERRRHEGGIFARAAAQFSWGGASLEAREGHREDCGWWDERRTSVSAGRASARIVRVAAWTAAGDVLERRSGKGPDRGGCGRPRERVGAHASWSRDEPAWLNAWPSAGAGSVMGRTGLGVFFLYALQRRADI